MKLTVKNFGPIREAKNIEIKPMTIFVGPSNTGKSYLAMLIYATVRAFLNQENYYWYHMTFRDESDIRVFLGKLGKSKKTAHQAINDYFMEWAKYVSEGWRKSLVRCFGTDAEGLLNGGFNCRLSSSCSGIEIDLTNCVNSRISKKKIIDIYDDLETDEHLKVYIKHHSSSDSNDSSLFIHAMNKMLRVLEPGFIKAIFSNNRLSDIYYLPAIRGGIMQSHITLVQALINNASFGGIEEGAVKQIPAFNGVLADFLRQLIPAEDGRFFSPRPRGYARHARTRRITKEDDRKILDCSEDIEKQILEGSIEVETSETGYPVFRYHPEGQNQILPLMIASSSVSELASVVFYIRNYLNRGNYFILEEPEAHLHPGAQRKIAGVLATLANVGVNVLITTHSDTVLEQMANFVSADNAGSKTVTRLSKENCLVYSFRHTRNKTVVKKVLFDNEGGFTTKDHLDVASELYNESVQLQEEAESGDGD